MMDSTGHDSKLFQPLQVGNCKLSSRLIMAPLARFRADDSHVQLPIVTEYYTQRACVPGTLIIAEATYISPRASGYANVPGIWSDEQISVWREIVRNVHKGGSYIYLQLWAMGRAATPKQLKREGAGDLVSSSAIPMADNSPTPRELTESEIQDFIKDHADAAKKAVEGAGFDGVEIHAANGYLVDQFTQDVCNKRTDKYGGSVENRARFGLEVLQAVVDAVGADKTAIRLSPFSTFQGMKMEEPIPQFSYLLEGLKKLKLSYIHLIESRIRASVDVEATEKLDFAIDLWGKTSPVFIAGGFNPDSARRAVDEEYTDKDIAIVFGRSFISNPDLVFRIKNGIAFEKYNRETFYKLGSADGYTNYPFSEEWQNESKL